MLKSLLCALLLLPVAESALAITQPDCSAAHAMTSVAALDTEYQAAVKRNDSAAMDRLLADDFVLVTGKGTVYSKAALLADARAAHTHFEHQEDSRQTVRVWGHTAVVTALLWLKGNTDGRPFDYRLWFSDTYV
ncbi:MAG TPA: nuclear transport factor 2 family protein, partial [Gammaproteobacteria bacterium]|nr:nuclear transport factor 2 family protein [Gammaproteobacteria bacterium]